MCVSENRENSDSGHDVGRLINTLSHQLKRQMCIQEGEDSLTTNMQRLVLHYILFQSPERDIYQKDVEKEFGIHQKTLAYWRQESVGPAYTSFGRRVFYERAVLEEYIASGRIQTSESK